MANVDFDQLYTETMSKLDRILQTSSKPQSIERQVGPGNNVVEEKQCELCRTSYPSRRLIDHHIVPEDIVQKTALPKDRTIELCFHCHRTLHNWNARNISWVSHESKAKRHEAKTIAEVVEEYESAYSNFIKHESERNYNTRYIAGQKPAIIGSLRPVA
jgi:hypothetical protein